MRDFRDVKVWGKARSLTTDIYRASASFPKSETYGLTHQVRSAAVSVAANIAEGCGRSSSAELRRFFEMASGSASELEALLLIATDLGYLSEPSATELRERVVEVEKMLTAFIGRIRADAFENSR